MSNFLFHNKIDVTRLHFMTLLVEKLSFLKFTLKINFGSDSTDKLVFKIRVIQDYIKKINFFFKTNVE